MIRSFFIQLFSFQNELTVMLNRLNDMFQIFILFMSNQKYDASGNQMLHVNYGSFLILYKTVFDRILLIQRLVHRSAFLHFLEKH